MNLSKIICLWSACLLLNFTVSQAGEATLKQGGSSSSSTSAPSNLLTPLQRDANEFLKVWKVRPSVDTEEDAFSVYENYINQLIEADNLGASPQVNLDNNLLPDADGSLQGFFSSASVNTRRRIYEELFKRWEGLINEDNAFANYFLGYLLAEQVKLKKYTPKEQEIIRGLLEDSSQKLYGRPTSFLLKNVLWQKIGVNRRDLLIRREMIEQPEKALYRYIRTHAVKGQATWSDLHTLENILLYNTNNPEEYSMVYRKLAEKLKSALILRKEKESSLRIVEFVILSTVSGATVLVTQGIINLVNNNANQILYYTIGATQIASAALGILTALTTYPYISNIVYKYQDGSFKGKLLPSSYSDDEISLQSHLIALLCIVLNKEYNINNLTKKSYVNKVRKFILNQFAAESRALSGPLNDNNKEHLELPVERQ